jgi:hypothetical protein
MLYLFVNGKNMLILLLWIVIFRFIRLLVIKEKPTFREELQDFIVNYIVSSVIYIILSLFF